MEYRVQGYFIAFTGDDPENFGNLENLTIATEDGKLPKSEQRIIEDRKKQIIETWKDNGIKIQILYEGTNLYKAREAISGLR